MNIDVKGANMVWPHFSPYRMVTFGKTQIFWLKKQVVEVGVTHFTMSLKTTKPSM